LDPKLEKHSVALSYKLAYTLSTHNVVNVILLIYLNSGKSVFNIASVSSITIKILDIFPCSNHILCKSFKQWAIAEQMCFVKDEKIEYEFCGRIFTFILSTSEVKSKELFRVGTSTNFKVIEYGFINNFTEENQIKWLDVLDDIAIKIPGYTKQVYKFCEYMFSNASGGFRGILLRGESGVGKTYFLNHILEAFSRRYPSHFTKQNITHELMRSNVGEAERYIRLLFTELLSKRGGVHVICIESLLDFQLGARTEQLLVAELIHCMDLSSKQNNVRIVLVAIMSNQNMVDSSLIRVGRLEYEIELKIPAPEARLEIFNALTNHEFINDKEFQFQISNDTHGYVAADLEKLCCNAVQLSKNNKPTKETYIQALKTMKHSHLLSTDIDRNGNKSKFTDLAGIDDIIQKINISILYPLIHREKYRALGVNPPRGVLLKGPSGTGKTCLARAIATEAKANFVSVQCTDIISKVVGAPSRAISHLFNRARASTPCVLFFDQFEAIARCRGNDSSESQSADQMLSTLLIEMDGINTNASAEVLVLAATNKPELLDPAILRPGRFDQQIELRIPNPTERLQIINTKLKSTPTNFTDSEKNAFEAMVTYELNGLTGADLDNWCRESIMLCLRENIGNEYVSYLHFCKAKNMLFPQGV
jgi:transitional endoplasmic reticulum ATPase